MLKRNISLLLIMLMGAPVLRCMDVPVTTTLAEEACPNEDALSLLRSLAAASEKLKDKEFYILVAQFNFDMVCRGS